MICIVIYLIYLIYLIYPLCAIALANSDVPLRPYTFGPSPYVAHDSMLFFFHRRTV